VTRIILCLTLSLVPLAQQGRAQVQLAVPFIPQSPPGDWHNTMTCGAVSVLMVASRYAGTTPDSLQIQAINAWFHTFYNYDIRNDNGPKLGYTTTDMVNLAQQYFGLMNSQWSPDWDESTLKSELASGYPVIIQVYTDMDAAAGHGHFMVLTAMDDKNVYVNDPGHTQGILSYPIASFRTAWLAPKAKTGTVVTIHPNTAPTSGSLVIAATLDGSAWPKPPIVESGLPQLKGAVNCHLNAPASSISISYVPITLFNLAAGGYSLACDSGNPGTLVSISPPASQMLTPNGLVSFNVAFVSQCLTGQSLNISGLHRSATLTTCPAPPGVVVVSCACIPDMLVPGQSTTCTAQPTSGMPPFQFVWTENGVPAGTMQSMSTNFPASGTYSANVAVTDSGVPTSLTGAATCSVQVNQSPSLSTSCSIAPNPVQYGQGATVSAQGMGGVPPYQYQMAPGLPFSSNNSIGVLPAALGSFTYGAILVKDAVGATATTSCSSHVSGPPLLASCAIAPNPMTAGQGGTVTASGAGGFPPYQYQMIAGGAFSSTNSVGVLASTAGIFTYSSVTVKDSKGQTTPASCSAQVNALATLTASCLVNGSNLPITVISGTPLDYAITPSGGNSPYHFVWSGVSGAGDTSTISVTPIGLASIDVSALVKDSSTPVVSTTASCPRVTINPAITTGTVQVYATMNGQPYSGAMACGFLNSPSNIQVNSVPFSQSNLPVGAYSLNCAGGPPNSQLQSFSPSSSQTLTAGGTIVFTAVYVWATVTVYANPLPVPPAGVSWAWQLSSWQSSGAAWIIQPVLTFYGLNYTFNHPAAYIEALKEIQDLGASGPLDLFISQFQSVLPSWPPYTVVNLGPSAPTVSGYYWNNTPQNRVLFSGNISGTGFVPGNSAVYFCINNTTTCYPQPSNGGVAVNSSISLSVYNVNLTSGAWQVKIVTPYGTGTGPVFYVQ